MCPVVYLTQKAFKWHLGDEASSERKAWRCRETQLTFKLPVINIITAQLCLDLLVIWCDLSDLGAAFTNPSKTDHSQ